MKKRVPVFPSRPDRADGYPPLRPLRAGLRVFLRCPYWTCTRGCFVSMKKHGELRGVYRTIAATRPTLVEEIVKRRCRIDRWIPVLSRHCG
jgi:hypothetical protein